MVTIITIMMMMMMMVMMVVVVVGGGDDDDGGGGKSKVKQKTEKYEDLKREISRNWNCKAVKIVPIAIGALGTLPKGFSK